MLACGCDAGPDEKCPLKRLGFICLVLICSVLLDQTAEVISLHLCFLIRNWWKKPVLKGGFCRRGFVEGFAE